MISFTDGKRCKIKNARTILPNRIKKHQSIVIEAGKIIEINDDECIPDNMPTLDANGLFAAPGCIDTHIHGGGGHDFTEATPEAFRKAASAHAKYGTTALFPTLAAAPLTTFRRAFEVCESMMHETNTGARIMGLHLEGNYLNKRMCGGQNPKYLSIPDEKEYKALLRETRCIKRWSAAPELPGALEFGRFTSEQGVLVSLAHTIAGYDLVKQAWESGYTHATHFYNAMTSIHKQREYKKEGTVEAIYLIDGMSIELIADGIHVPPALLELAYRIKGVDNTILVTDAMAPSACENPESPDPRMIIEDGVCKLADRSALCGSIATTNRLIRTLVDQAKIPLTDAVRMASEVPARLMGINDRKGSLAKGKDADLILFNDKIQIQATFVEGRLVYTRQ